MSRWHAAGGASSASAGTTVSAAAAKRPASAEGSDSHSALAVQDRIRELIAAETPADVLSDDAIVVALKKNGVDIARRTVAKYREGLNIPSSVERRREKRALAGVGR